MYPDESIVICEKLSKKEKIEAEAHELMHILLNKQGLLRVVSKYEGKNEFLAMEINNAISHKILISRLRNDYNIESELHLKENTNSLSTILRNIEEPHSNNDTNLLKEIGVRLYDIYRTISEIEKEIIEIVSTNQLVESVFQMAKEILSRITIDSSKEVQLKTIKLFLLEIDVEPRSFYYQ